MKILEITVLRRGARIVQRQSRETHETGLVDRRGSGIKTRTKSISAQPRITMRNEYPRTMTRKESSLDPVPGPRARNAQAEAPPGFEVMRAAGGSGHCSTDGVNICAELAGTG
ncbi:hypothetical protein EAG_07658 [Camponotus floridanus]|uniref:Uncharacterized protein n=1 Tax=Camponotus floridanus TaxID=104421 RepID=E2ANE1_CAMFO|nr:hypothetical protein EAG_07658 [Camponotus floridanus]